MNISFKNKIFENCINNNNNNLLSYLGWLGSKNQQSEWKV